MIKQTLMEITSAEYMQNLTEHLLVRSFSVWKEGNDNWETSSSPN